MPLSAGSKAKLVTLYPPLCESGMKLAAIAEARGIRIIVTQALRTWAEQDTLYAKGRARQPDGRWDIVSPAQIVTKAKGGESWHNFAMAFDIAILEDDESICWDANDERYKTCGAIGRSIGLEWGGDWAKFRDVPHFQWPTELSLAECRQIFMDAGLQAVLDEVKKAEPLASSA